MKPRGVRLLAFIGALGSRRTHRDRVERLNAAGISAQAIQRVQSPLGLDLDAQSPEETAVSIAAQKAACARTSCACTGGIRSIVVPG
ncbi:hypothetical protein CH260_08375 [Rhodococcus sp. 05-2256-B2]|nr:hypothetical protein CH258_27130 [Rhodococcus sp. 05-2256-B4]OZD88358.1 hypothetical protein CH257_22925 [Rhodococcus sp. 05-2256-B3]OZD98491.1 hypothetical protein CH260_08375 [Rhodococcus sp. 05-2256-B2]OZE05302.1 hypothetical protein CH285_06350 [Rhodococcus sp. 05-2256-B1]